MKQGLNSKAIKSIDKSDMLTALLDFPGQCATALDLARRAKILFEKRDFREVLFAGLGGSAIGADLVRSYLYFASKLPIAVAREYELPAYVGESTLVFISSYSGNTEETVSAYKQAREKQATIIVLSCNGSLKEMAKRDRVTFIELPGAHAPRCALGYLSIIPLLILAKIGLAEDATLCVNQAVGVLEELRDKCLNPAVPRKDNIAKAVALQLVKKFAVVYSASVHFDVCAIRLRGQIAENAKALASSHLFPEMNHNEIVGWQNPGKLFKDFTVVMLRDKKMHPRVGLRMDITAGIIQKEGVKVIELWSRGENLLSRIFSLIYTGDFISYYLAILYGIDPTPVERVTYLKNRLAKDPALP